MTSHPNLLHLAFLPLPASPTGPINRAAAPSPRKAKGECSAHPLCEPVRTDSCWAGDGGHLEGMEGSPTHAPGGPREGRLAGRRKHKLFGATLGEISFWNVPPRHTCQCLQGEGRVRAHRRSSLFPQVLVSTPQKRVAHLGPSGAPPLDSPCPGSYTALLCG